MSNRVTRDQLDHLASVICVELGAPTGACASNGKWNIGALYVHGAYDGVTLERIVSEYGATSNVLNCGYVKPRALYDLMHAYLAGIRAGKQLAPSRKKSEADIALAAQKEN